MTSLSSTRRKKQLHSAGKGEGLELFKILKMFAKGMRSSTDPRDWIYGLLAMPNDLDSLDIVPDYTVSYETVSSKFTRNTIKNGNLDILRYSQFPKAPNFTSWAPDWKERPRTAFDYADDRNDQLDHTSYLFQASGDSQVSLTDVENERLLALECLVLDEIDELGMPWSGEISNHSAVLGYVASIRLMCMISMARNQSIYSTKERRAEAVWRIPIADIWSVRSPEGNSINARATAECEEGFRKCLLLHEMSQELALLSTADKTIFSTMCGERGTRAFEYRRAMRKMENKRPFMTKLGYIGLGPVFAKPGDKVVVLLGAAIPFVIRPVEDKRYFFLGEAYCDGIMDGEILKLRETETIILV